MMSNDRWVFGETKEDAWEEHNLSQLKYFQSLSLREKLAAIQGMADVTRRLRGMRTRGELKSNSGTGRAAHALSQMDPQLSSAKHASMRMTPVDSTAIARVGYDPAKQILRI